MDSSLTQATMHYILYSLRQFVLQQPLPSLPTHVSQTTLHSLAKKHHLRLLFYHSHLQEERLKIVQLSRQYLFLKQALIIIVNSFAKCGIACIVLKGIPLNQQLYDQQTIREARDIDILVQLHELMRAHGALIGLGYQPQSLFQPEDLSKSAWFLHKQRYRGQALLLA